MHLQVPSVSGGQSPPPNAASGASPDVYACSLKPFSEPDRDELPALHRWATAAEIRPTFCVRSRAPPGGETRHLQVKVPLPPQGRGLGGGGAVCRALFPAGHGALVPSRPA